MGANFGLKGKIVETYGSQTKMSRVTGIGEAKLSRIIQGHKEPTDREREAMEKALGRSFVKKALSGKN